MTAFSMNAGAEAEAAVIKAKAKFPTLTASGVGSRASADFDLSEVETALAFLRHCRPTAKPKLGSYGLKHCAERWGRCNGMSSYVSNGALICAAVFLDLPISNPVGPNVLIGVNTRDVDRLNRSDRRAS